MENNQYGAAVAEATRRRFLAACSLAGVGSVLFPGVLLGLASASGTPAEAPVTDTMIEAAARLAGLSLTAEQRQAMLEDLNGQREGAAQIRVLRLPNGVAPSLVEDPVLPGSSYVTERRPPVLHAETAPVQLGASREEQLAFASVRELHALLKAKSVTSMELTRLSLSRLRRYDPKLHFLITATEERALAQAATADREIAADRLRGPLHGVPWGAKDLLAVKGYPTTWGAAPYMTQHFDEDAEVVKRLDAAGAVLTAKLTLGALAQGDLWGPKPGVRTRNPWNPQQGSSGSSAGVASAVAAGCVGFGIGTETLGSISSPSTRCGCTGLRPSFGLVPRTGAMALSWSMDKIGPITRSVEDAVLVLEAIYGPDGKDPSVKPAALNVDLTAEVRKLRVGYVKNAFEMPKAELPKPPSESLSGKALQEFNRNAQGRKLAEAQDAYDVRYAQKALEVLRTMGIVLEPVDFPHFHYGAIVPMLEAEAAAAFDELTRSGQDATLAGQASYDWPNSFRVAQLYPAVDYINASRARRLAMEKLQAFFSGFDVIVATSGGAQLTATNLCGQPAVIVPNGFRGADAPKAPSDDFELYGDIGGPGTPVSLTFLAPLYGEAKACLLAAAYQQRTGFERQRPPLFLG